MANSDERSLDDIRLLDDLPAETLRKLEGQCRWRVYQPNEKIIDRFSDDRDVFFVVGGAVQILNYSYSGREIAFARIRAGGYFGELAAIDGAPRSATVMALDKSLLAAMEPACFNQLLSEEAMIAKRIIERMARIIRRCDDRIMDLSTLGAVQPMAFP